MLFILIILFVINLLCYLLFSEKGPFFLLVATGIVFVAKDFVNVDFFSDLSIISKNRGKESQKVIALSMLMTMIFTASFAPLLGALFDIDMQYGIAFVILLAFLILYLLKIKNINFGGQEISKSKVVLPKKVYKHCLLSFIYNSISFFGLFFITPVFIFQLSEEFGFTESSFKILGVVLGIAAFSSIIKPNKKSKSSQSLMLNNYALGIVCWLLIGFVHYLFLNGELENMYVIAFSFIVPFIIVQISSKLWSAGFVDVLKQIAEEGVANGDNRSYKKALSIFMIFKASGGLYVFLSAFLLYDVFEFYTLILFNVFLAVIVALFYRDESKKDLTL